MGDEIMKPFFTLGLHRRPPCSLNYGKEEVDTKSVLPFTVGDDHDEPKT
jgi:hypothetical protein